MSDKPAPSYADLVKMLQEAPPWQAIGDERYRRWQIEALEMADRAAVVVAGHAVIDSLPRG